MKAEERRERWEARTEVPLMVAAVLFLAAFAWPIIDTGIRPGWASACVGVTYLTWLAFAGDYLVRVVLSRDRWRFVRRHPFDLVVVALPFLRPLVLLRVFAMLGVLNRRAGSRLHGRVGIYVVGAAALIMFLCSLLVLEAERGRPGAVITSFPDALWWAATTVTTVGYGDEYPTSGSGRAVAAVLMFCGIALIGSITASVASWLVDQVKEEDAAADAVTQRDVHVLTEHVVALREEVVALRRRLDGDAPGGVG